MPWYDYLMCFFGGTFVANFVPHFVRGITGTQFPTPFANPPGRGMSPPAVNVLWALVNLIGGILLLEFGEFSVGMWQLLVTAFLGFALMALLLSRVFDTREMEATYPSQKTTAVARPPVAGSPVDKPPADKPPVEKPAVEKPAAEKPASRDMRSGL